MKFYRIDQHNSGGSFLVDDKVCHRLIIEAKNSAEANNIAESLGCYWDGCYDGRDCDCCGDRWHPIGSDDNYIDLAKYKSEGYSVSVYNHYQNPEQLWYQKYGKYNILLEPVWDNSMFQKFVGKIYFNDIEQYAQFMADEYGWTTPDIRIYYKDGIVKEVYKNS